MPEPQPATVGSQFASREDTVAQSYRSQERTKVEEVAHLLLRQREQLDRSLGHLRLDALDVRAEAFRLLLKAAIRRLIIIHFLKLSHK